MGLYTILIGISLHLIPPNSRTKLYLSGFISLVRRIFTLVFPLSSRYPSFKVLTSSPSSVSPFITNLKSFFARPAASISASMVSLLTSNILFSPISNLETGSYTISIGISLYSIPSDSRTNLYSPVSTALVRGISI